MKKRLRSLITISLVAGSLVVISCGDNKKEQDEEPTHTEMHQNGEAHSHEPSIKDAEVANLEFRDEASTEAYTNYLAIKDALVATNAEEAAAKAQKLVENENAEISAAAKKIAESDDVNMQREAFSELTKAMEPVIKDNITSGKVYKQFCPMAFEGKGDYWYSDSDQIRNPYFGDKMLKCGRVDETIEK